ncbi:MAG: sigma-70 factor domain-containing protein [Thermomicrobiales bacterium]
MTVDDPQEDNQETGPDRRLVDSIVELATRQGPIGLDELLKFVDPDQDPATFDLLETELGARGLIITPDDEGDDEAEDDDVLDGRASPVSIGTIAPSSPTGIRGRASSSSSASAAVDDLASVSVDDPVRMYLREIGRVDLLTSEEEVYFSKQMERRQYLLKLRRMHEAISDKPLGPFETVSMTYDAFRRGWIYVVAVYTESRPDTTPASRSDMLRDVLPVTALRKARCNRLPSDSTLRKLSWRSSCASGESSSNCCLNISRTLLRIRMSGSNPLISGKSSASRLCHCGGSTSDSSRKARPLRPTLRKRISGWS